MGVMQINISRSKNFLQSCFREFPGVRKLIVFSSTFVLYVQKTAPLNFCTPPDQPGIVSSQWRIGIKYLPSLRRVNSGFFIPENFR